MVPIPTETWELVFEPHRDSKLQFPMVLVFSLP